MSQIINIETMILRAQVRELSGKLDQAQRDAMFWKRLYEKITNTLKSK